MDGQVTLLGQVLAQETVGVLVGATLPGAFGIAELDLDAGVDAEADVLGHLWSLVPSDGPTELGRQGDDPFGEGVSEGLGPVALGEADQHQVARLALDEGADRGEALAHDEVALPVA